MRALRSAVRVRLRAGIIGARSVIDGGMRGDFGGRVVPEIARPPRLRAVAIAHTQAGQLGDRRQPIRPRASLGPAGLLDRGYQRSCVH